MLASKESEEREAASHFYQRSLAIKEAVFGADAPALCDTLYNLAQVSMELNQVCVCVCACVCVCVVVRSAQNDAQFDSNAETQSTHTHTQAQHEHSVCVCVCE